MFNPSVNNFSLFHYSFSLILLLTIIFVNHIIYNISFSESFYNKWNRNFTDHVVEKYKASFAENWIRSDANIVYSRFRVKFLLVYYSFMCSTKSRKNTLMIIINMNKYLCDKNAINSVLMIFKFIPKSYLYEESVIIFFLQKSFKFPGIYITIVYETRHRIAVK